MSNTPVPSRAVSVLHVLIALVACSIAAPAAIAQTLPDEVSSLPWVVDGGSVESFTRSGDRIYLGGSFRSIARPSSVIGPFGAFDATTAELRSAEPALLGQQVHAVAPDGAGGWFLGGRFVIGARTLAVVRLDASGRQSSWSVEFDGQVEALARAGGTLYLSGSFNTVGGLPRQNVAAVDIATGAVLPWNPGAAGIAVYALKVSGNDVFLGGRFSTVGGVSRSNLARVDAVSGAVLSWAPAITAGDDGVRALEVTASTVFVGGGFDAVDGVTRQHFAAIDRASGILLPAAPDPGGGVYGVVLSLAAVGNTVYMGGIFERVAGVTRYNAAAVDVTTGLLLSWAPVVDVEGAVRAIQPVSGGIVLGGDLGLTGRRRHVAMVDAISGAVMPSWDPAPAPRCWASPPTARVSASRVSSRRTTPLLPAASPASTWSPEGPSRCPPSTAPCGRWRRRRPRSTSAASSTRLAACRPRTWARSTWRRAPCCHSRR